MIILVKLLKTALFLLTFVREGEGGRQMIISKNCLYLSNGLDIINFPIFNMTEDDYEDIMPKADRISTYISKLISWRPPCFGDFPFSDEEETLSEEEVLRRREDIAHRLGQNLPSNDLDVQGETRMG